MAQRSLKNRKATSSTAPSFCIDVHRGTSPDSLPDRSLIELFRNAWAMAAAKYRSFAHGQKEIVVDLHLISDVEIAKLNQAHMKHSGATDVLSFPMGEFDPERGAFNLGEIVVSFETAQREAAARKLGYDEELGRYCVHGFLHLLRYDDDTSARQKEMFAVQEKAIKAWQKKKD